MNKTAHRELDALLDRQPFAVLGYSAEGSTWCPACLRSACGLSPQRGVDYDGAPILPLHARDATVREEACNGCGRPLLDLLLAHRSRLTRAPVPVTASLHQYGQARALSFDGVPPSYVRDQLKHGGWRWDSRYRLWWCTTREPEVPAGVTLSADYTPRLAIVAQPPARRRPGAGA